MPTVQEMIDAARPHLIKAVKADQDNHPDNATDEYLKGCATLLAALKLMPEEDSQRSTLTRQINGYMDRAEALKPRKTLKVTKAEQRRIAADSVGHSYDTIFGKCLDDKLNRVEVKDAYIVAHHQVINFVRFCELVVSRSPNLKCITLTTSTEGKSNTDSFNQLAQSMNKRGVLLRINYSNTIHDREITFDNGWTVKIGRGLDYFKRVDRFAIGSFDMSLRPCHETTVDILKMEK